MKTSTKLTTTALVLALGLALTATDASAQKGTRYVANRGAKINTIFTGWPAADAGLEVGDVITHIGGVQITSTNHLVNALAGKSRVTLSVVNVRDGSTVSVTAYPRNGKLGINFDIVDVGEEPQGYGAKGKTMKRSTTMKQ